MSTVITTPDAPVTPVVGSELAVLNRAVFEHTVSCLPPETVASYLKTITERGDAVLRELRKVGARTRTSDRLATEIHTLGIRASLLGFARLAAMAYRFKRAIQLGTTEAPGFVDCFSAALEATLQEIHDRRTRTIVDELPGRL